MECSSWSGAESLNLQFMVPKVRIFVNSLSIANKLVRTRAEEIQPKFPSSYKCMKFGDFSCILTLEPFRFSLFHV